MHGVAKASRGSDAFALVLAHLHVPMPHVMAWATILVEVIGGVGVLIGAFMSLLSIPMIAVLLVAVVTVHWPYGFSSIKLLAVNDGQATFGPPGYETALLYVACLVAIVLAGPGPLSVDGWLARKAADVRYQHAREVNA